MIKNNKYRLLLKCKKCRSLIFSPQSYCKGCGISFSFFAKENNVEKVKSLCATCHTEIEHKNIPNICFQCGSLDRDFWDQTSNNWIQKNIVFATYKQAIWLKGDFVGDYVGELIEPLAGYSIEELNQNTRKYDVKITSAQLDNFTFSDKPPQLNSDNSIVPIRQSSIKSVLVKELDSDEYVPLDLVDIVIYDWRKIADKEFLTDSKIVGRISGKMCGCMVRDAAAEISPPVSEPPVSEPPASEPPVSEPPVSEPPVSEPPASEPPASEPPVPEPPVPEPPVPEPPASEPPASATSPIKKCIICQNWFQLLSTFLIFFVLQNESNLVSSGDLLLCHLKQGFFFYLSLKLVCYLREKILSVRDRYLSVMTKRYLGVSLFFLCLLSLIILVSNSYNIQCFGNALSEFWPWVIFICFLLSVLLDSCFFRTSIALIFAYTIILIFSCSKPTCYSVDRTNKLSFGKQINNVENAFKGAIDDKKQEILEDKLKDFALPESLAEKRLTLKDLTTAPNPLSGCDASLYLGELSLFDRGSSVIKSSATGKLFKVADLLKEQPIDSQYIITGHADKTGEKAKDGKINPKGFANNMRLSKERANSLANWLISHKILNKEQLDIRGVGSTEPLVDDSDLELQKVNIRVEIRKNCDLIN